MKSAEFASTAAQRLRAAREAAGLSQGDVARLLHVTPQAYGNWERGTRGVPIGLLPSFSRALGHSVAWILDLDIGLTDDEDELVTLFRGYRDARQRELLLRIARSVSESESSD